MLTPFLILIGIGLWIVAGFIGFQIGGKAKGIGIIVGLGLFFLMGWASSYRFISEGTVGIVVKNALGSPLPPGRVIATSGEMGVQAKVLSPGIHGGYWPILYGIQSANIITIKEGEIGVVTAADGLPLPAGQAFAPEWGTDKTSDKNRMLDAEYFLGEGKGYKGPQSTILGPGQYYLNTRLFTIEHKPATRIGVGEVGVVKSNIGDNASTAALASDHKDTLVSRGQRGIWREPYGPQLLYINPSAYEITKVSTVVQVVEYTDEVEQSKTGGAAERPIDVKTSDGFTFPVDVRVEYYIEPINAPLSVSMFGDDHKEGLLRAKLHSTVREIFRNTAEKVKALDYVNKRSEQGAACTAQLTEQMIRVGVTILAVRIGNVDNAGKNLGALLKTQTDREIATQQQATFAIQQAAAEKEQNLNKAQQAAKEEVRLATASYDVRVNEQQNLKQIAQATADAKKAVIAAEADAQQKLLVAQAEAKAIQLKAEAVAAGVLANQKAVAQGYEQKARAIGGNNLALIEAIQNLASGNVKITPDIIVGGGSGGGGSVIDAIGALFARNLQQTGQLMPVPLPITASETRVAAPATK